jgi:hypothetical protein
MSELVTHLGGCHCGRVRFEVDAPPLIEALDCNCTMCAKSGYLHLIVARDRFRLLQGADELIAYRWGTGAAAHFFCRVCGIKSWYVPRSNPDGIDVNVRCLDCERIARVTVTAFDGRTDWDAQASAITHLSR